jgi:hypothetical protein
MCDAIGAVTVTEYKPVMERQLPSYGIEVQIDPGTFAGFHTCIVSNLGAETADRNEIIHGAAPLSLGPASRTKRLGTWEPFDEAVSSV